MKKMVLLIFLLVISVGLQVDASELDVAFQQFLRSSPSPRSLQDNAGNIRNLFTLYEKQFGRRSRTTAEETARYTAFNETVTLLLRISQQGSGTCNFELNDFADKTPEELRAYRGARTPSGTIPSTNAKPNQRLLTINAGEASSRTASLPTTFDYTTRVVSGTRTPIVFKLFSFFNSSVLFLLPFSSLR